MTRNKAELAPAQKAPLAEGFNRVLSELRVYCEKSNSLPVFTAVWQHFFGDDAYVNYSFKDWVDDAELRHYVLGETELNYRLSLVMACVVSGRVELEREDVVEARERLGEAQFLMANMSVPIASLNWNALPHKSMGAQNGGYAKKRNAICRSIMESLKINHHNDLRDFKTFLEAVSFGIESIIEIDRIEASDAIHLRRVYPDVFRSWLLLNAEEGEAFEHYTGLPPGEWVTS